MKFLYFAYGSNLDEAQMRRRCPGSRPVGLAVMNNHALCFVGYSPSWRGSVASFIPRAGFTVQGALYALTERDLRALDAFEGHPVVYRRVRKRVTLSSGRYGYAYTYVHRLNGWSVEPGPQYLNVIKQAYRRHGFDKQALTIAAWGLS